MFSRWKKRDGRKYKLFLIFKIQITRSIWYLYGVKYLLNIYDEYKLLSINTVECRCNVYKVFTAIRLILSTLV